MSHSRRPLVVMFAALTAAWCCAPAQAQQKEVGDQWEVATEMSMPGMSMPGMTQKVCVARGNDPLPAGGSGGKEQCETYDLKHSGNTVSWKMRCTNPTSTGTGQMTYKGRDAYSGLMTMEAEGSSMQLKLTGRRLGECDAGESKRQVAAMQKQADDAQRQSKEQIAKYCGESLKEMRPEAFSAERGSLCAPAQKKEFCTKFQTTAGFAQVARQPGVPGKSLLDEAGKVCAVDAQAMRGRMCKTAEANESLDFLADACAESGFGAKIAARECAGHTYTSPVAAKYRKFCSAYGRNAATQAQGDDTSATAKPDAASSGKSVTDDAVSKGKELLKGLFR